jgi:hypothetical protein
LRRPFGAAGEDDVLGLLAAQGREALLAQYPAQSVGDVALAAAIGTDDRRYAGVEEKIRLGGEGLEAVNLQSFEIQSRLPR